MREHLPSPLRRQNNYGALPAFRRLETNASGLPPLLAEGVRFVGQRPHPQGGWFMLPLPVGRQH